MAFLVFDALCGIMALLCESVTIHAEGRKNTWEWNSVIPYTVKAFKVHIDHFKSVILRYFISSGQSACYVFE